MSNREGCLLHDIWDVWNEDDFTSESILPYSVPVVEWKGSSYLQPIAKY